MIISSIGKSVKVFLVGGAMLGLLSGCGGGGSSSTPNPLPSLKSISYPTLAAGSPDTTVTISGANFISSSEVMVGSTPATTTYVSPTEVTAVVPASTLNSAGTLQVTVNNPAPGGGTSASSPLTVVKVAAVVVLATPATAGDPGGPWLVAAEAVDSTGNGISGLPVTLSASQGTLSAAQGMTAANGTFNANLSPPATLPTTNSTVSATTGSQTAVAVISFANSTPTSTSTAAMRPVIHYLTRRKSATDSTSTTTYYPSPFSMGISNNVGYSNVFSNNPNIYECMTDSSETSTCKSALSSAGVAITIPPITNSTSCQQDVSLGVGIVNCAITGTFIVCAGAAVTGVATAPGLACMGLLAGVTQLAAPDCFNFLLGAIAKYVGKSTNNNGVVQFSAVMSNSSPSGAMVGAICNYIYPTSSLCADGKACLYVANGGNNSITVYDMQGNPLPVPPGAFPGLDAPDGIVYDDNTQVLYVTNTGNDTVTAYTLNGTPTSSGAQFNLPQSGVLDPEDITQASNGNFFINDPESDAIYVFNEKGTPVSLPTGAFANIGDPWGVFYDSVTQNLYVANETSGTVTVYNTQGASQPGVSGSFSGVSAPDDLAQVPETGNIYVTNFEYGSFGTCAVSGVSEFTINGDPVTPSGGFSTVDCPDDIVVQPTNGIDGPAYLYVSNVVGNSITVYDTNGDDITASVAPGGFPGVNEPTGMVIIQ